MVKHTLARHMLRPCLTMDKLSRKKDSCLLAKVNQREMSEYLNLFLKVVTGWTMWPFHKCRAKTWLLIGIVWSPERNPIIVNVRLSIKASLTQRDTKTLSDCCCMDTKHGLKPSVSSGALVDSCHTVLSTGSGEGPVRQRPRRNIIQDRNKLWDPKCCLSALRSLKLYQCFVLRLRPILQIFLRKRFL